MKLVSCWPFPPWCGQRLPGYQGQHHPEQNSLFKNSLLSIDLGLKSSTGLNTWSLADEEVRGVFLSLATYSGNTELCHHVASSALGIGGTVGRHTNLVIWRRMPAFFLLEAVLARVNCNRGTELHCERSLEKHSGHIEKGQAAQGQWSSPNGLGGGRDPQLLASQPESQGNHHPAERTSTLS